MKNKKYLSLKTGMTLTEILVVVSIIAFISVLVTSYLRSQIFKGNDARRKTDLSRIGIAFEEYEKDNDCYHLPDLVVCNPGTGLRPYLDKIPCDPINGSTYMYEHEDSICPRWYRIYSSLENESDNDYIANIGPNSAFSYYYSSPNAPAIIVPESTPGPTQESEIPPTNYYGCFNGVCEPISWDPARPGPECEPNFQNSGCYGRCIDDLGNPANSCIPWK